MKERKTTPVVLKPPAQVIPSVNLVYGFVLDELFQNKRRRLPVDALDSQEAPVEPCLQELQEITIHRPEVRIVSQHAAKVLAHGDDRRRTFRSHVQEPEQLLAWRFHCGLKRGQSFCIRLALI